MSVVTAGIFLIGLAFWFAVKRKTFTGPQVNLQLVDEINAGVIARETAHVGIISGVDVVGELSGNGMNIEKRS
jgi:hypothetical protein